MHIYVYINKTSIFSPKNNGDIIILEQTSNHMILCKVFLNN